MAKIIMRATGVDGQIDLLKDRVVIHRKGIFNMIKYGMHAKREIPLSAISEVAFKDARGLGFGQIEFVRSGRSADEKTKANHSAVKFNRKAHNEFEALKEKIFELMEQYSRSKNQ